MRVDACSKTYNGRMVLQVPALELQRGKIYAVIGANGSGKTTFSKIIVGITAPDGGAPVIDETLSVGYMHQKNYAFRMSTRANILIPCRNTARAERLMKQLRLTELADQRADRLSGGELARMALARILMKKYDLLILDEPTAAMDVESALLAERIILDYCRKADCALILVTHSLQQARRMADEVLFFYRGKLLEQGEKEQVLTAPVHKETKEFIEFYGV